MHKSVQKDTTLIYINNSSQQSQYLKLETSLNEIEAASPLWQTKIVLIINKNDVYGSGSTKFVEIKSSCAYCTTNNNYKFSNR